MTEQEIKEQFKSKMEGLCFQSTSYYGMTRHDQPVTVQGFWEDASYIMDEALDALLALKE